MLLNSVIVFLLTLFWLKSKTYKEDGLAGGSLDTLAQPERLVVKVEGRLVSEPVRAELLSELQKWAYGKSSSGAARERPSVLAKSYMIVTSPAELELGFKAGSRKATKEAGKLTKWRLLWDASYKAIAEVDPDFAAQVTGVGTY